MVFPWRDGGLGERHVVLVRGLPGAGKSTFVRREIDRLGRGEVYSPDLFFYQSGEYRFEKSRIGEAHAWCRVSYLKGLMSDEPLIFLDYPFVTRWQYEDYECMALLAGYDVSVVEMRMGLDRDERALTALVERGVHSVPIEVIKGMVKKWYEDPRGYHILEDVSPTS